MIQSISDTGPIAKVYQFYKGIMITDPLFDKKALEKEVGDHCYMGDYLRTKLTEMESWNLNEFMTELSFHASSLYSPAYINYNGDRFNEQFKSFWENMKEGSDVNFKFEMDNLFDAAVDKRKKNETYKHRECPKNVQHLMSLLYGKMSAVFNSSDCSQAWFKSSISILVFTLGSFVDYVECFQGINKWNYHPFFEESSKAAFGTVFETIDTKDVDKHVQETALCSFDIILKPYGTNVDALAKFMECLKNTVHTTLAIMQENKASAMQMPLSVRMTGSTFRYLMDFMDCRTDYVMKICKDGVTITVVPHLYLKNDSTGPLLVFERMTCSADYLDKSMVYFIVCVDKDKKMPMVREITNINHVIDLRSWYTQTGFRMPVTYCMIRSCSYEHESPDEQIQISFTQITDGKCQPNVKPFSYAHMFPLIKDSDSWLDLAPSIFKGLGELCMTSGHKILNKDLPIKKGKDIYIVAPYRFQVKTAYTIMGILNNAKYEDRETSNLLYLYKLITDDDSQCEYIIGLKTDMKSLAVCHSKYGHGFEESGESVKHEKNLAKYLYHVNQFEKLEDLETEEEKNRYNEEKKHMEKWHSVFTEDRDPDTEERPAKCARRS